MNARGKRLATNIKKKQQLKENYEHNFNTSIYFYTLYTLGFLILDQVKIY